MKRLLALSFVFLVLASAAAPVAAAQAGSTSFVTMYGHMFGYTRDTPNPMNTQFPLGGEDISQGLAGHGCGLPGIETCEEDTQNEVWFYSTAGFVDITDQKDFTYSAVHNERGLTKDIVFDTTKNVEARFHMSADMHGWLLLFCNDILPEDVPWPLPCWNWDPGYLPQWQVEATLYAAILGEYGGEANTAPPIASSFTGDAFKIIAQGVSEPIDVFSLQPLGYPTVWAFDVDMGAPQIPVMAKENSLVLRFQFWSVQNGERVVVPEVMSWNVDGGEFYPPFVKIPVKNAFDVEMVLPQFIHGKLVILGILNAPWGSYDVDSRTVKLTIEDSSRRQVVPVSIEQQADFSVAHGGHYKPVNITWVWDYKKDGLAPGTYKVTVEARNFQHSASATCTGEFTVGANSGPGPVKIGECGTRTITDEQLREVQEGAARSGMDERSGSGGILPEVAGATGPAAVLVAGIVPFMLIGRRRWTR